MKGESDFHIVEVEDGGRGGGGGARGVGDKTDFFKNINLNFLGSII